MLSSSLDDISRTLKRGEKLRLRLPAEQKIEFERRGRVIDTESIEKQQTGERIIVAGNGTGVYLPADASLLLQLLVNR